MISRILNFIDKYYSLFIYLYCIIINKNKYKLYYEFY